MKASAWSRGSDWRRWDPHIHTPITVLANRYPKPPSWDAYLDAINGAVPAASALGITDYLAIDGYEKMRSFQNEGRLPGIELLFANVEFRLSVQTKESRGINLHLIFSPEDPDHVARIKTKLHGLTFTYESERFACSRDDLTRLGRTFDPSQRDEPSQYRTGVEQFKIDFSQLRSWYEADEWLQRNCLVAIAAGKNDGTSGVQHDGAFAGLRRELQRFAHIIFSGNPGDRNFWLGNGAADLQNLENEYGGRKPCLHGCDAHALDEVLRPKDDKFCWIKAASTFDGLRQTLLEPEERVYVGGDRPSRATSYNVLRSCAVSDAQWMKADEMSLNDGLITIIGPRGSGKTALADIIAAGAEAYRTDLSEASFLHKAGDLIAEASVTLRWGEDEETVTRLGDVQRGESSWQAPVPRIRYLSQQFVEQLCNAQGLGDALLAEIEEVIFAAIDETDRLNTSSFGELMNLRTTPIREGYERQREEIRIASAEIAAEDRLKAMLGKKRLALAVLEKEIAANSRDLARFVTKGTEKLQAEWQALNRAYQTVEGRVTSLKVQRQALIPLADEVERLRSSYETEWKQLPYRYPKAGLKTADWAAFRPIFAGNPAEIIAAARRACDEALRSVEDGPAVPGATHERQPLRVLRNLMDAMRKELGADQEKQRKYAELQEVLDRKVSDRKRLIEEITHIEQSDERRALWRDRRYTAYRSIFDGFDEERRVLEEMYAPLHVRLEADQTAARKLAFYVHRKVDIARWAAEGEDLVDLRREGPFQGAGTLQEKCAEILGSAWKTGTPDEALEAMKRFLAESIQDVSDKNSYFAAKGSLERFATWLFSTEHISLSYGIRYEGVEIERLSPGTRGIVLLLLYLAIDRVDTRPLLIDQPEENLDPQSVFDVLVPFLKQARHRRQVVLVTHNPNLVVNTDADQVIIASATREKPEDLPQIKYDAGPLEDPYVRERVCEILEGGERAFRQRERRYAMHRAKKE